MRSQVRAAWPNFVTRWEGRVPHMYLDTLQFVTFGIGRKIDDNSAISDYGLTRPWRDRGGALMLESKIKLEWSNIKSHTELAPKGGHAFAAVATLHLDDADIDEALLDTTDAFWASLANQLPALETWPADAQIALLDMAYHMGPAFLGARWPNFTAAAKAADFAGCARHCPTAKRTPRDTAHAKLFTNAAAVFYAGLDPGRLWGLDGTPQVDDWPVPGAALVQIDASRVAAARPNGFSVDAWYVQRMLALAGKYKVSMIDGMFGPVSRGAFAAWAREASQPNTINTATLGALSQATLRMPVG